MGHFVRCWIRNRIAPPSPEPEMVRAASRARAFGAVQFCRSSTRATATRKSATMLASASILASSRAVSAGMGVQGPASPTGAGGSAQARSDFASSRASPRVRSFGSPTSARTRSTHFAAATAWTASGGSAGSPAPPQPMPSAAATARTRATAAARTFGERTTFKRASFMSHRELVRERGLELLEIAPGNDRHGRDQGLRGKHVVRAVDLVTLVADVAGAAVDRRRADPAERASQPVVQAALDFLLNRLGRGFGQRAGPVDFHDHGTGDQLAVARGHLDTCLIPHAPVLPELEVRA